MHAHRQAAVAALGRADELQPEPELARVLQVVAVQVLDAFVGHVVEVHRRAERQAREDRHLRRGVAAGDVVGGVGLGIADALGLGQRLRVGRAAGHLGEDEVRRAVDDPVDALDRRRRQRFLEHAHDRHGARHGRLEAQPHVVLARRLEQLLAVLGEQLLVRADHVPAGAHRRAAGTRAPVRCRRSPRRAGRSRRGSARSRRASASSTPQITGRRPLKRSISSARSSSSSRERRADRAVARAARP